MATPASGQYPVIARRSYASSNSDGWNIYATSDGGVTLKKGGVQLEDFGAADGKWHQVAFTFDGTTERASVDGTQRNTSTVALAADTSTAGITVGEGGTISPITIDELAFYPTAVSVDHLAYQVQAARHGSYDEGHTYDTADRITDSGYTYDQLGRTLTVPSKDAGGTGTVDAGTQGNATLRYYANDFACTMQQGVGAGSAKAYTLDPLYRIQQTTTGTGIGTGCTVTGADASKTTIQHYAGSTASGSEAASWTENISPATWTRNIAGLDGNLAAESTGTGTSQTSATVILTDLHGSILGTHAMMANATPSLMTTTTEFGITRPQADGTGRTAGGTGPDKYGWLGGKQRDNDALASLTLMGERLYNPTLGRFLTTDPVPGGSCSDYDYACQDPINRNDLNGQQIRVYAGFVFDCSKGKSRTICVHAASGSANTSANIYWNRIKPDISLPSRHGSGSNGLGYFGYGYYDFGRKSGVIDVGAENLKSTKFMFIDRNSRIPNGRKSYQQELDEQNIFESANPGVTNFNGDGFHIPFLPIPIEIPVPV